MLSSRKLVAIYHSLSYVPLFRADSGTSTASAKLPSHGLLFAAKSVRMHSRAKLTKLLPKPHSTPALPAAVAKHPSNKWVGTTTKSPSCPGFEDSISPASSIAGGNSRTKPCLSVTSTAGAPTAAAARNDAAAGSAAPAATTLSAVQVSSIPNPPEGEVRLLVGDTADKQQSLKQQPQQRQQQQHLSTTSSDACVSSVLLSPESMELADATARAAVAAAELAAQQCTRRDSLHKSSQLRFRTPGSTSQQTARPLPGQGGNSSKPPEVHAQDAAAVLAAAFASTTRYSSKAAAAAGNTSIPNAGASAAAAAVDGLSEADSQATEDVPPSLVPRLRCV